MIAEHNQEIINNNDSKNAVFNSFLDSYVPVYSEAKAPLNKLQNLEDVLEDGALAGIEITEEQLDHDMAMCRYYEGEE